MGRPHEDEADVADLGERLGRIAAQQALARRRDPQGMARGRHGFEQDRVAQGDQQVGAIGPCPTVDRAPGHAAVVAGDAAAVEHGDGMAARRHGLGQVDQGLLGPAHGLVPRRQAVEGKGIVDEDHVHGAGL